MILILSNYEDSSTNQVVDWLTFLNEDVLRINTSKDIQKVLDLFQGFRLSNRESSLEMDNIKSVWFRRFPAPTYRELYKERKSSHEINRFFASENSAVIDLLHLRLQNTKWLNDNKTSRPRKINQLLIAKEVGLSIPNTAVIGTKEELIKFKKENDALILKPLQDPHPIQLKRRMYMQYTAEVNAKLINSLPNSFYPCLFQKKIDKNLEIRTFYMEGKCFSMAICSSFDKQTQIDFRRYNKIKPNRRIPYKLPSAIEIKICNLMSKLNLNCGSLDLVLDNNGIYYYLEVNPVGQFGMVSFPCNYYLEKKIAEFLSTKQ
ncbi:MAG: grasp-with-spasm system ATP-grasp peptide maturase [Bacteroidales bacterium]|nr:grasp-with-spasm system ATP-grasp peptide maturase [Bacteroidales bacterium]